MLAANGVAWAVGDLALHAGRHVSVPLPGYFTDSQVDHALADAALDAVLTDAPARFAARWPWLRPAGIAPGSGLRLLRRAPPHASPLADGVSKITYTSGSTGTPAGIALPRTALEAVAASVATATAPLGIRRHLALLPLATLLENVAGLYSALLSGAECVLPPATGVDYGGVDAPALLRTIDEHAPGSLILVPELLRLLVGAAARGWRPPATLRFIAVGGATVAPALLEQAARLGLPVFEGYGLSECASVVALNLPGANRPGSVGRPLPHARVRIDARGEIHVAGAVLAGRIGERAASGAAPRAAADGEAEVATGDLGELDADGYLHVRGRRRNVFITSLGRNLSPEWIERELLLEPAVAQACVFGEALPHPVALLAPAGGAVPDPARAAAVRAANARLPGYARVRRWARVPGGFSPADGTLTANGRPRRNEIAVRHASRLAALCSDLES